MKTHGRTAFPEIEIADSVPSVGDVGNARAHALVEEESAPDGSWTNVYLGEIELELTADEGETFEWTAVDEDRLPADLVERLKSAAIRELDNRDESDRLEAALDRLYDLHA